MVLYFICKYLTLHHYITLYITCTPEVLRLIFKWQTGKNLWGVRWFILICSYLKCLRSDIISTLWPTIYTLVGVTHMVLFHILTYGQKLWVVFERTRSLTQAVEMSFVRRVARLSLRGRVKSSAIRGRLRVEVLLLHIARSQLNWFSHLTRIPPRRLLDQVFWACPTWRRPQWQVVCMEDTDFKQTFANDFPSVTETVKKRKCRRFAFQVKFWNMLIAAIESSLLVGCDIIYLLISWSVLLRRYSFLFYDLTKYIQDKNK